MFTRNYYLANVAAQLIPISYYDDIVNQIRGINGELIPELEAYGDRKGGRTTISNKGRIGSVDNHMKKTKVILFWTQNHTHLVMIHLVLMAYVLETEMPRNRMKTTICLVNCLKIILSLSQ